MQGPICWEVLHIKKAIPFRRLSHSSLVYHMQTALQRIRGVAVSWPKGIRCFADAAAQAQPSGDTGKVSGIPEDILSRKVVLPIHSGFTTIFVSQLVEWDICLCFAAETKRSERFLRSTATKIYENTIFVSLSENLSSVQLLVELNRPWSCHTAGRHICTSKDSLPARHGKDIGECGYKRCMADGV
jgi:hypothetical protein